MEVPSGNGTLPARAPRGEREAPEGRHHRGARAGAVLRRRAAGAQINNSSSTSMIRAEKSSSGRSLISHCSWTMTMTIPCSCGDRRTMTTGRLLRVRRRTSCRLIHPARGSAPVPGAARPRWRPTPTPHPRRTTRSSRARRQAAASAPARQVGSRRR